MEKVTLIFDLIEEIKKELPSFGDGDVFYIPMINGCAKCRKFYTGYSFECTLNERLDRYSLLIVNISKNERIDGVSYGVSFTSFIDGKEMPVTLSFDEEDFILEQILYELTISANEHKYDYKNVEKSTLDDLDALCKSDVTLLIHGTDLSKIDSILSTGLNTSYESICRTTSMIEKTPFNILSYNFAWNKFRPRNVLFAIDNTPVKNLSSNFDGKKDFKKCENCTSKIMSGFDLWCYDGNYLFEIITETIDEKIVIPPNFIYGVLDLNGNLVKNPNHDKRINCSEKELIERQKRLEIKMR